MTQFEKSCPECGALHRIIGTSVSFRDSDNLGCRACGAELYRWNGAVVFRAELVEDPDVSTDTAGTINPER